jgi:NADH-quinone oxidoreductase subunit C
MISQKIIKKFSNLAKISCHNNQKCANELTIEVIGCEHLLSILTYLKQEPEINMQVLIDLCVVDYLNYGISEWNAGGVSNKGFSRGTEKNICLDRKKIIDKRFVVVYHLLSILKNHRLRLKCFLNQQDNLTLPSCISIWENANWYEREAFDLFGITFVDHPNLNRLFMEDDFREYPLRKDFPLSGNIEARFDGKLQKVIYEPVEIESYNVVPKVIRKEKSIQSNSEPVT